MALDLISSTDNRFLEDNLLSSEDWGDPGFYVGSCLDDSTDNNGFDSRLNDHETDLSAVNELLSVHAPSRDLTSVDLTDDLARAWMEVADEEHLSELNGIPIKNEPLSPPPSSDSSDSSSESSQASHTHQNGYLDHVNIKLESPPLTPPRDSSDDSPSLGNPSGSTYPFITLANNAPLANGVTKSLAKGVFNGAKKGVAIAPKPLNGAVRLPIAPKPEPTSTATVTLRTPTAPTVTVKHIPATVRPSIVVRQTSPSPFLTGSGSCSPPPAKQAKVVPVSHPSATSLPSPTSPTQPIAVVTQPCPPDVDVKAWKRQQRMIKNRESACLSRKKKKEYVTELECKAENMEKEIQRLRSENVSLRSKMEVLVKENSTLKKMHSSVFSSPARTATCLLGIVLILGVNLSPISLFSQNGNSASDFITDHHASRALLGFSEPANQNASSPSSAHLFTSSQSAQVVTRHASIHDIMADVHLWESLANQSASDDVVMATMREIRYLLPQGNHSCPHQMNLTDSIRLTDVLQFWAKRQLVEQKNSQVDGRQEKKKKKKRRQSPYRRFRSGPSLHVESDERGVQLYDHFFQRTYDHLLEALNRKDDTFYVVSFRNDHLLLPATAHNNTRRPKMSLVMPTVTANESMWNTPKDHISMMQIDCEVIDTKIVHVKDSTAAPPPSVNNHTTDFVPTRGAPPQPKGVGQPPSSGYVAGGEKENQLGYHPRNLSATAPP